MSTDCPPQLQLSIQPNTTSFKRSFEQFGFDLESPVGSGAGAHAATSDGRGERNKRARSTISFDSETSSDASSDTLASTSSSTSSSVSESGATGTYPVTEALPLRAADTQDVDMSEYSGGDHREASREGRHNEDRYHLALQRFNEFDSEIAHLRQPSLPTTPPPTLPPLRHRLLPDDVAFFRQAAAISSPFPSDFFSENPLPGREPSSSQTPRDIVSVSEISNPTPFDLLFLEPPSLPPLSLPGANPPASAHLSSPSSPASTSGFRDRLNTALERLRSPSPLVPGLDDSDPELRGDEDDMQDSEEEQGLEVHRFEGSSELPPVLPPIQTTDAVFHNPEPELQPPSVAQSTSPDPPMLPPIPAADRPWHTRGQLFDNFLGSDLEHNPPNPPPLPANHDMRASPRPFSRSASSSLASSSTPQTLMSNSSLVDHPLPSPILRDLHSWIEERQPVHNQAFAAADGASSTAAAAGTDASERDTSSSVISPSASVASSPTSDAAPTDAQHDRLSRMLDRIRTGARVEEWAGHSSRRPWPPHAAPWTSSSAETNILQDLLPWYHSSPTAPPASSSASAIPNASPETSRPISTTPALNPPLSAGDNMTLDAFWEPLFNSITYTRPPRAQSLLSSTAGSEQQWHQRPEDSAVRSTDNRYGDRHSPSAAEATPRLFESFVAPNRGMGVGSLNHWQMVAGEASGLTSEPADGMSNRDRQASDPIAGLWRPLEPTELPLHLHFSAASSTPNTPADIHPYFSSNTAANNDAGQAPARPLYGSTLRHAFGTTQHPDLTLEIPQRHDIGNSSARPASLRTEPRRIMERHEVIREMLDATESAAPVRPPMSSSLSNWNGRSHGAASQTSGFSLTSNTSTAPAATSGGEYERVGSTAVDARRTDPRLRHRLVRSYSQNRPGSGTSLVAENTSEVRRRIDHAELRRMHASMVESDSEEPSAGSSDSAEAAEAAWRWRRFTAAHREGDSGMPRLFRLPNPVQPSNLSDLMDTSESTTPNGQNTDATTPSNQPYPLEAPSLPPPDLGSSFTAGPQTRLATTSWASEHVSVDDAMETSTPTSMSTDTLFAVDSSSSRPNRSHSRFRPAPRMTTTAMPNVLRQLQERGRQLHERDLPNELPRYHQMMMDDRMSLARDRHQHYERTLQESRRLLSRAAEHTAPLPTDSSASSERGQLPIPHSNGNFASILNPTTATSIASGLNVTRPPPTTEPRRVPPGDPTGRYTHFDPSTFAAGPFRNTLQHFANERDLARVDPYAARAYMRQHPPPHIPPLSFDSEHEYSLSSPTRADSMAELRAARTAARASRESGEVDRGPTPHSRTAAQGALETAAEAAARPMNFIVPSNDNTHNGDPNTARWLSEQQRSAIAERYRSQQRRMDVAARLDASSRHAHAHAREHVAPSAEDSINAMRMPPAMQRHRRAAQFLDDDEAGGESLTTIGTRNPRRIMRGNSIVLSRMPPNAAGMAWRRGRPMGDFVRDEDFDSSYESLLSLGMQIGDVKPRATPSEVLSKMQKGVYRDFAGEGTDTRCPICLDDYELTDPVQKLNNCSHWLHEGCLSQWLQTASTCPVCRESVTSPRSSPFGGRTPRFRAMPFNLQPRRRRDSSPTAPTTQPPAPTASILRAPRLPASRRHTIFEDSDDAPGADSQESNGRISNQGSPDRTNFAPWRFHHP